MSCINNPLDPFIQGVGDSFLPQTDYVITAKNFVILAKFQEKVDTDQ